MKTANEVRSDKLRGGFYTPQPLVNVCLERIAHLNGQRENLAVLEPSVGDGAFLRGLAAHQLAAKVGSLRGIELVAHEAEKSRHLAQALPFETSIVTASTVEWALVTNDWFDVVVGNPPFVRYQFVSKSDLRASERLGRLLRVPLRGVSNLWIPVLLGALNRLRPGGTMAIVVPAEIFTGLAAGDARAWLLTNFTELRVDMFQPGSFPDVLQEVIVISGRRVSRAQGVTGAAASLELVEHFQPRGERRRGHLLPRGTQNWTRHLLMPAHLDALTEARSLPGVKYFGDVAKLEVSIVTGANDFFSVSAEELERFRLQEWAVPLLARMRHTGGLIHTAADQEAISVSGAKAWLLNFGREHPNPQAASGAAQYLAIGEARGLHLRYKTSIRTPWYRVPSVWPGCLMLSKRAHRFPRLVFNAAGAVTTDTIYRGRMLPMYTGRELDLVASFHNSLTLLTAELEGRSFGGGVLELVPSEIARLSVPFPTNLGDSIVGLDRLVRGTGFSSEKQELLIEETDALLYQHLPGLNRDLVQILRDARESLVKRRLSRN